MNTPTVETLQGPQTRTFALKKETSNKRVYVETPPPGTPEIVGTLYVSKWWAGEAKAVEVTITRK